MKKRMLGIALVLSMACTMLAGCGETEEPTIGEPISSPIIVDEEPVKEPETPAEEQLPEIPEIEIPAGYVASELTGLPIKEELKNQRPIAVMVDNEVTALDHYGLNEADIIYEMMNSTENDRVTRFMCLVKDWGAIKQFGSVRSARVTNCILAIEYNAILCHDGGPYTIPDFANRLESDQLDHLSGVFSRVDNGKAREFTEYVCTGDLAKYVGEGKISPNYNKYYTEDHFTFVASDPLKYNSYDKVTTSESEISLFPRHNKTVIKYNASTGKYEYSEYGRAHVDGATGEQLAFDNVIILKTEFHEYGLGYLMYYVQGTNVGWYLVDGKAVEITWSKPLGDETQNTVYTDSKGNPVTLKAGKTYIALIPDDDWSEIKIK